MRKAPLLASGLLLLSLSTSLVGEAKTVKNNRDAGVVEVVPGLSLGPVKIGATKAELLELGFTEDAIREAGLYYRKGDVLVRLKGEMVVQIWHETENMSKLRFKGKKFPRKASLEALKKFFSGCEKDIEGSGGLIVYCENRGIEITTSYPRGEVSGFSITTPQNAAEMIGPTQSK